MGNVILNYQLQQIGLGIVIPYKMKSKTITRTMSKNAAFNIIYDIKLELDGGKI